MPSIGELATNGTNYSLADRVRFGLSLGAFSGSISGAVEGIGIAAFGLRVPSSLPAVVVAAHILVVSLLGAGFGAVLGLPRLGLVPGQIHGRMRQALLLCYAVVAIVSISVRPDFLPSIKRVLGLGSPVDRASLGIGVAIVTLVGGVILIRRCSLRGPDGRTFPLQVACLSALAVLPLRFLFPPWLRMPAVMLAISYTVAGLVVYVLVRGVLLRIPRMVFCLNLCRWNLLAATLISVAGVAFGSTLLEPRLPIDRAPAPEGSARNPDPEHEATNVVLIVMDCARVDHLSVYGYPRQTSPNLERFARQASVYTHAISTSSWSLPSHASLFTGLLPSEHGAHRHPVGPEKGPAMRALSDEYLTLAEMLESRGYETGAISGNAALVQRDFGFSQGFRYFDDRPQVSWVTVIPATYSPTSWALRLYRRVSGWERYHWRFADEITDEALAWLEGATEPFFLFMNYMDAHEPYQLHEGLGSDRSPATDYVSTAVPQRDRSDTARRVLQSIRAYDSELAFVDSQIERVLAALRRRQVLERSLVVVTSDHGEAFGEHGQQGHSRSLYDEEVRIPLLIRRPGQKVQQVNSAPFSLASVPSVVLDYLGFTELGNVAGRSVPVPLSELRLAGEGREPSPDEYDHVLLAESKADGFKVIIEVGSSPDATGLLPQSVQLYDLRQDPFELHNLSTEQVEYTQSTSAQLMELFSVLGASQRDSDNASEVSDDLLEELRALGYVR